MSFRFSAISFALITCLFAADTDTRVADAAMQGDRESVRLLLKQSAPVNAALGDGTTALYWAAAKDDLELTKLLVRSGASVSAKTRIGSITPLFVAAKNGSAAIVEVLLKAGSDANAANDLGTTPLMMAAASGSADSVKALLAQGAFINAREHVHGQTALMFASALNRGAAIKVLMLHGADANATTAVLKPLKFPREPEDQVPEDGKEAAAKNARASAKKGDKADAKDEAKQYAMPPSAYEPTNTELRNQVTELKAESTQLHTLVQSLVARLTELEKHTPGMTQPSDSAKSGTGPGGIGGAAKPGEEMRGPREFGAALTGGMTALLFASRDGQMDAVRALLQAGADINEGSVAEKTTPLVMAISNGHYDLAKFLLDNGANPNIPNIQGLTPLYTVIDVQWAGHGWYPSPVTAQETTTYLALMKALLDQHADPNARLEKKPWFRTLSHDATWVDPAGATAFWRAAQASDMDAMKLLLEAGADPKIPTTGGDTALMVASGLGWGANFSVNAPDSWLTGAQFCLSHGIDVNAVDTKGYTALHGAAYIGNNEIVNLLVQKGAKVTAKSKAGDTVADMANGPNRFGIPHPETVALLETLGSANSHNCRSDQCLVAPKEEKKDEKKENKLPITDAVPTPAHLSKPGGN